MIEARPFRLGIVGLATWWLLAVVALSLLGGCSRLPSQVDPAEPWAADAGQEAPAWPAPPERARIKFLTTIGSPDEVKFERSWARRAFEWLVGRDRHAFVRPYGIAARDDALVVTDPGSGSVHVFDLKAQRYRNLSLDDKQGGFISPLGVALDDKGLLYVSDSERALVFVMTLEGKLLRTIGSAEELGRPAGVALNPRDGNLYVVDVVNHRVVVYDSLGKKRFQFGSRGVGQGEFNFPTNIVVTEAEEVCVTDSMNFRVQVFGADGTFRFAIGRAGDSAGDFSKPKGVAVDSVGHIYIVDALYDVVQVLNREGSPLIAFGTSGQGPGEFWLPSGIWIDKRDRIYVADSFNQRIQVFQYVP